MNLEAIDLIKEWCEQNVDVIAAARPDYTNNPPKTPREKELMSGAR